MDEVAVCYITRGRDILVFEGHPGGGVQVVGGRVEAHERPQRAAMREALEEAGLSLSSPIVLGTEEWHGQGASGKIHEFRHYFWFRVPPGTPDAWDHRVSGGETDIGRVFRHRFVSIQDARLDWGLDARFPQLLEHLR